jgi:hypothetical protein
MNMDNIKYKHWSTGLNYHYIIVVVAVVIIIFLHKLSLLDFLVLM